ncbi:MAG: hypothetical protein H7144_11415 [Burkholderiales bacterium]|nr:hypothetical protein [Phycisphaerae bacterium]
MWRLRAAFFFVAMSLISWTWAQTLTPAPTTAPAGETGPAFIAFGDSAGAQDADRVRSTLDVAKNRRSIDLLDDVHAAAPGAAAPGLPPELVAKLRPMYEKSIADLQKQIDSLDPVNDRETREQFVNALNQTKAALAGMEGQTPAAPAPASTTSVKPQQLKRPTVVERDLTLAEAIAGLDQMVRENADSAAIDGFKASPDYASAKRCAAAATAAMLQKRPIAAIAAMLRAHELEPQSAAHLINLAGLTTRLAMPRHTLALLDAAETLDQSANAAFGLNRQAIILNSRGMALVQLNKLAEAEAALRQAVALDPSMSEARVNLAHALWRQDDPKKKDEAVRFARWSKKRAIIKTAEEASAAPPEKSEPPAGTEKMTEEKFMAGLVADRHGRPPAAQVFDLSRGKKGALPTIKIPRTIGDGYAMYPKVKQLHEELLAESSKAGARMNQLETIMRNRERSGQMPSVSADRARDVFWYISHANTDPSLRALYWDQWRASMDIGVGTFGGQLTNPWASHELQKKHDAIMAASMSYDETCQQMTDATEPYHLSWLGPIKNYETAINRYARAAYRHQTALAANLYDPVHHEYAKLLIKQSINGRAMEFLAPLLTVTNYDQHFATGWGKGRVHGSAEDPAPGEYEEADACPAHLSGEYKVKVEVLFVEISGNCEKIGVELSAGAWIKGFAEVEVTFEGEISIFIGGAGEASAPGVPVTAGAKAGCFITITKDGDFVDAGFKTTTTSGIGVDVGVGGAGYEREIENVISFVPAFSSE